VLRAKAKAAAEAKEARRHKSEVAGAAVLVNGLCLSLFELG
jgi:hypothetical protein